MRTARTNKNQRTQAVWVAGSNRGARENLSALAAWNRQSTGVQLAPRYLDGVPGRAEGMKLDAGKLGVPAEAHEATIEATIAAGFVTGEPIIMHLDRASAIAETIFASEHTGSSLLGYLLVKFPSGEMWGIRFHIRPHDLEARRAGVILFHRLGELSARRGSAAILGADGDPAHRAVEARYRTWFATHTRENLDKLIAKLEPTGNTFEVTDDGVTTYALIIRDGETWTEPVALAAQIAADPPVAVLRGESFVIGEVTPDGVRFHKVRRRKTDDRVVLRGIGVLDNASVDTDRRAHEAADALARAERQTVSKRSPVLTTD